LTIVSNTSPILNLAAIGQASLLENLFGKLSVPSAVANEIHRLQGADTRFSKVILPAFVTVVPVSNSTLSTALALQLHAGEAEALALAIEQKATRLLLDEHLARSIAARFGIPTMGCLGILLEAKSRGIISEIRPILDDLQTEAGFWVGQALRARALQLAGE
jgi:uncharacterized protein